MFGKGTLEHRLLQRVERTAQVAAQEMDTLLDVITATKFKPRVNPAATKAFFNTGGGPLFKIPVMAAGEAGAAAMGHGAIGPAALAAAMTGSSPRFNFRALQAAKAAQRVMDHLANASAKKRAAASIPAAALRFGLGTQNNGAE